MTILPTNPKPLSWREALRSARETRRMEQGRGAISLVPDVFRDQFPGKTAVVVADPASFAAGGKAVQKMLEDAGVPTLPPYVFPETDLYAEIGYVERLEAFLRTNDAIAVAVGSGTINDLSKLASFRVGRQYMCVGTAASMDGYTAFGASITSKGSKQTFNCPAPQAIVADTEIICKAPPEMTASGYADLMAKLPAGADWIMADLLETEPIDTTAWAIVQPGLAGALSDPAGARRGDDAAIGKLIEGLMLGGFAMQWSRTSRPASGAEHQFSHMWDMQHHTHNGKTPAHGFKVGVATLAITSLYEELLKRLPTFDLERACAKWATAAQREAEIRREFAGEDYVDKVVEESMIKHPTHEQLRARLKLLKERMPQAIEGIKRQLPSYAELKKQLDLVGAPTAPEAIGITRERLRHTFTQAYYIRRRFTALDLAKQTDLFDECMEALFGKGGRWDVSVACGCKCGKGNS